jgi:glycerophosphoryl diester phosphodiesterase
VKRPLLLGHRGLRVSGGPAENTLDAFDSALDTGCDGFEFDVRLTADNVPVIVHDAEYLGREVARTRMADLRLLTLDQVLARYAESAFLDIEVKVPGLEEQVSELTARQRFSSGCVVSSFLPEVLTNLHARDATLPLGFLCDQENLVTLWRDLPIRYFIPHYQLLNRALVDEVQSSERKVLTWTVNRSEDMLRLAGWGVDGLISDDPHRLVTTLKD